jgi:hypothetical protein
MISFFTRLKFAFRTFFAILFHERIPADVRAVLAAEPPAAPVVSPAPLAAQPAAVAPTREDGNARAAQILALFQRDGRLIDFLMEDVTPYTDVQVGAAVRSVHAGCRQTLQQYLTLAPAVDADEGASITVAAGTDAATVKVMGNVAGQPPFRGIVRHRGWIASRLDLPPIPPSARLVIAPAEVEVQ